MPVRRQHKHRVQKKHYPNKKFILVLILFILLIISVLIIRMLAVKDFWVKDNRTVIAFHKKNGDIVLVDADPVANEMVNITIPGNTEIETAGNFGKRRIGNIWELGFQEKMQGRLLASSVTNALDFPVVAWSDEQGLELVNGSYINLIKSLVSVYKTNLSFSDRLSLGIFARRTDNINRTNIKLEDTDLLKKSVLDDGDSGYLTSGLESSKINSYFYDYYIGSKPTKIIIEDRSSGQSSSFRTGKILEVLGGKVVAINHSSDNGDFVCQVSPKSDKRSVRISALFGCQLTEKEVKSNDEIMIILGNKFEQYN